MIPPQMTIERGIFPPLIAFIIPSSGEKVNARENSAHHALHFPIDRAQHMPKKPEKNALLTEPLPINNAQRILQQNS